MTWQTLDISQWRRRCCLEIRKYRGTHYVCINVFCIILKRLSAFHLVVSIIRELDFFRQYNAIEEIFVWLVVYSLLPSHFTGPNVSYGKKSIGFLFCNTYYTLNKCVFIFYRQIKMFESLSYNAGYRLILISNASTLWMVKKLR